MDSSTLDQILHWCKSELGAVDIASDYSKIHGEHESTTRRLQMAHGFCYLKIHETEAHWHNEVHAYEHWAGVFGEHAPRLLAVREAAPMALVVSELAGQVMDDVSLTLSAEQDAWRAAGAALAPLHTLPAGDCFGRCRRDGACAEAFPVDVCDCMTLRFDRALEQAQRGKYIDDRELATIRAVYDLIPAFAGERPTPCHRDYCTANWLVDKAGVWSGVIDFEFAYWDVRVADFSRDPNWSWIRRPDLVAAFFEGYGLPLSGREEQQLLVTRTEYALSAILWGRDNEFFGFEREGREALAYLAHRV